MATRRQPRAEWMLSPHKWCFKSSSHHSSHLTSRVIKRFWIVINRRVLLHYSKFGHARIPMRMNKEQISATGSKNSGWDVRVDTGERDPGRENPRGHLTQHPQHSLPSTCTRKWKSMQYHIRLPFSNSQNEALWISNIPWNTGETLPDRGRMLAKVSGNLFIPWLSQSRIGVRKLG